MLTVYCHLASQQIELDNFMGPVSRIAQTHVKEETCIIANALLDSCCDVRVIIFLVSSHLNDWLRERVSSGCSPHHHLSQHIIMYEISAVTFPFSSCVCVCVNRRFFIESIKNGDATGSSVARMCVSISRAHGRIHVCCCSAGKWNDKDAHHLQREDQATHARTCMVKMIQMYLCGRQPHKLLSSRQTREAKKKSRFIIHSQRNESYIHPA